MIHELSIVQLSETQHAFALQTEKGSVSGRIHRVSGGYKMVGKEFSTNCIETSFYLALAQIAEEASAYIGSNDWYETELEIQRAKREHDLVVYGGIQ